MTPSGTRSVVVVGAGVTGLSAAHAVLRAEPSWDVTVLESREHAGGNIRTERIGEFLIDAGPDSFVRTKPDAVRLCRELGLEPELIQTKDEARHVYVAHAGKLEELPGGMALAIPTRLEPLMKTPLLSLAGKLRMLREPLVRKRDTTEDESIFDFFARRLGQEAAEKLAGPLLGGIYAGDVRELGIGATFPQLAELERRHGSLLRGLLAEELSRAGKNAGGSPSVRDVVQWLRRRGAVQAASPFLSLRGGMGTLIDALLSVLPAGAVRTGSPVRSLARDGSRFRLTTEGGSTLAADAVILACPAHMASRLVGDQEAERELSSIRYVSTATVFFGLDGKRVAHDLRGFGFIVPPGEAEILAATWVSSKWEGRAPAGHALIRAFVGGARDPRRVESSTDDELSELARRELERFMGPLGTPHFTRVHRYVSANPQPCVGHLEKLSRIRDRLAAIPGLYVAGSAYEGVGIPDCVRQAEGAAARAVEALGAR